MLEMLSSADHVCAVRLSGAINGADYDSVISDMDARLARHERICVYADCASLRWVTPGVLLRDIRAFLQKLPELHRIARVAVVAEQPWLSKLTRLAHGWYPFEIESFRQDESADAMNWLSERMTTRRAGLRLIPTSSPGTYAYEWDGEITRATVEHVMGRLRRELEKHDEVRVIGLIDHVGSVQPSALLQSSLLRLKQLGFHKLERYALVGGPAWLARVIAVLGPLSGVEMRHFARADEGDAWSWIDAQPVVDLQFAKRPY